MKPNILKFKYRPKQFKPFLYGGIVGIAMGLIYMIFFSELTSIFFVLYGLLMLSNYFYSKNISYVILDDKGIKVNRFFPIRFKWEDYEGLRFYVVDIRVLSKQKTIHINKEFLNQVDIEIIEEELKSRLPKKIAAKNTR